eukprot:TRINITY_DN4614_c0_g1_i1.p1 TRINITY_DN4614_c0_g1~~TRINITY_DN4614_c0_g1_i1.p1  ORF type:complete len:1644 (+),score=273.56 TRINITY_DN4614_c0_g1_i1:26-4933(+)
MKVGDSNGPDDVELGERAAKVAGSASSGSGPQDSSTASRSNTLTGSTNKVIDVVRFVSFQVLRRKLPLVALNDRIWMLLYVVQVLQLYSFCLHPAVYTHQGRAYDGGASGSTSASSAAYFVASSSGYDAAIGGSETSDTVIYWLLRILNYVRGSVNFTYYDFSIFCAISTTYNVVFMMQIFMVLKGSIGHRWAYTMIKFICIWGPAGTLAFLRAFSNTFSRDNAFSNAGSAVMAVAAMFFTVLTIMDYAHAVTLLYDFRASWGFLAASSGRYRLLWLMCKLIMSLTEALLLHRSSACAIAHACTVFALALVMLVGHVATQLYYNKHANWMEAGVLTTFVWLAVCMVVAVAFPPLRFILFLLSFAGIVPGFALGPLLCLLRMKYLAWRTRYRVSSTWDTQNPHVLGNPFMYDLVTKFVYSKKATQADHELADKIFCHGVRFFPKSTFIRVCYAAFLIEVKGDVQGMKNQLSEAKRCHPFFDISYIIYCFSQSLDGRESTKEDKEMDLSIARHHAHIAKKKIAEFWTLMARSQQSTATNSNALFDIVRLVDLHEKSARAIFQNLMSNDPTNPVILRNYGQFLHDVCDSAEQAEQLFALADECEEIASKKKARSKPEVKFIMRVESDVELTPDISSPNGEESASGKASGVPENSSSACSEVTTATDVSATSAASCTNSTERNKILQYRAKMAHFRSKSVTAWVAANIIGLLLLLAFCAGLFGVVFWRIDTLRNLLDDSSDAIDSLYGMNHGVYGVRCLQRNRIADTTVDSQKDLSKLVSSAMQMWTGSFQHYAHSNTAGVVHFFPNDIPNNYTNATCHSGVYHKKEEFVWSSISTMFFSVDNLARSTNLSETTECGSSFLRFMLDNYVQSISGTFSTYPLLMYSHNEHYGTETIIAVATIYGVAGFCLLVLIVIYFPITRAISNERNLILRLFADIPKSTLANMLARYSTEDQQLEFEGQSILRSSYGLASMVRVALVYFITLVVMFAACSALFALAIAAVVLANNQDGNALRPAEETSSDIIHIAYLSNELVYGDNTTWDSGELQQRIIALVDTTENGINELQKLNDRNLKEILFKTPCPAGAITCTGLVELLDYFLTSAQEFLNQANHTVNASSFQSLHSSFLAADTQLLKCQHVIISGYRSGIDSVFIAAQVVFSISVPLTVLFLMIAYQLTPTILAEYTKLVQLLLTLPANILFSQEATRHLLDTGMSCFNNIKGDIVGSERQTKILLEASKDAVVGTNQNCLITIFNPAAESLFGISADDVMGREVDTLFAPEDAREHRQAVLAWLSRKKKTRRSSSSILDLSGDYGGQEKKESILEDNKEVVMVSKAGELIPVLISTSAAALDHDNVAFASFIKDIRSLKHHEEELQAEKHRADQLLLNILPESVIDVLKTEGNVPAQKYESVTILFADIVNFTPMSGGMTPESLVAMLNELFSTFDHLCDKYKVEKVKTIGDCFMAATGVPVACEDHAQKMVSFAIAALRSLHRLNEQKNWQPPISMRFGVNTGSVVAGVIGQRKFQYDLWGDAVNIASRLESSGVPDKIHVGPITYNLLKDRYNFQSRGLISLKGKGEMETYLLDPPVDSADVMDPLTSFEPKAKPALDLCGLSCSLDSLTQSANSRSGRRVDAMEVVDS